MEPTGQSWIGHNLRAPHTSSSVNHTPPKSSDTAKQDAESQAASRTLSRQSRHPQLNLPGYDFDACLGDGAFGSVWLAHEENTGRQVAIKIYSHHGRLDWSLLSREVEKLAALDSSRHIVGLLAVGWDSDPPYYIMEYLEQGSLAGHLKQGPLPVAEAARIARGVLQGLVHAHGRGILHCDLKPANVLLDDDLSPRLCDFGQSRLSHEQDPALGTLYYMAPEQADLGGLPDVRWDVYALGALLYHLLIGSPPYKTEASERAIGQAETLGERLAAYRRHVSTARRTPDTRRQPHIDRRLADIVHRCLAHDPSQRFPSAQSVLDAFDSRDRHRSRRPLIALGGLLPLLLLAAMFLFGISATNDAVDTAQENVLTRALESDLVSARIMARGVERELESWQSELTAVASNPRLVDLLVSTQQRQWQRRDSLNTFLEGARLRANRSRQRSGRRPDASWFLVDSQGTQRWRGPRNEDTLDRNWAHRDYFHGRGREFEANALPADLTHITAPHLSLAFQSRATGHAIVALSCPITNEQGEILAILAGTRELGAVLSAPYAEYKPRLGPDSGNGVSRTIAILDARDGRILDHPWLSEHVDGAPVISLTPALSTRLTDSHAANHRLGHRFTDYNDPVGAHSAAFEGSWLAAATPVGTRGWFALVQERRTEALQPITAMQHNVVRTWQAALSVCALLLTAIWAIVLRSIGGRTGEMHAPPSLSDNTLRKTTPPVADAVLSGDSTPRRSLPPEPHDA